LKQYVEKHLNALRALDARFTALDAESRDEAPLRAMALEDTPKNRLFLRYKRATETGFERAIKTLTKLQDDRKKVAEIAVKKATEETANEASRNEPNSAERSTATQVLSGFNVNIRGHNYEGMTWCDPYLTLRMLDEEPAREGSEGAEAVDRASETDV
jgi:hypothetical protein